MNFIKNTIIAITIALCLAPAMAISQAVNSNIDATTPDIRFTDNENGTVTDKVTGLMWKKAQETGMFTWQGALQKAQSVNNSGGLAGYTDWRVPNVNELRSIVEEKCFDPAINLTIFPGTISNGFWSSSPASSDDSRAFVVMFTYGYGYWNLKGNYSYIRLVRGGQ